MGLDTVELVMQIEEDFGITISDAVAEHCRTPNDVALYVYGQVLARPASDTAPNPLAARFHELRRVIAELTKTPPDTIRLESPAAEAIPRPVRRTLWSTTKVPLPELQRPRWARMCIVFTGLGVFIVLMGFFAAIHFDAASAAILAIAISVPPTLLCTLLLRSFKREMPRKVCTINDLVQASFGTYRKNYEPLEGELTFPQVLLRIRQLTADQMGIPLEKVQPHSRFVQDLDMG